MVSMLLYPEKRMLINGIMSENPSKKLRLDFPNDGIIGNEDLWGQDELTAEEFDMLEIQATQVQNQNNHFNNVVCAQSDLGKDEHLKHVQYELEGRIASLSQSLEKSKKVLGEERSNRQKIINDKIKEISSREYVLKKEVEKLQSIIEFKEQEMKSVYSKLQLLKSQVEKKGISTDRTSMNNKHFEDFLKSSSYISSEKSNKLNAPKFCRRNKLLVDTPRGEAESVDILSSALCTRFAITSSSSSEHLMNNSHGEYISNVAAPSPISIIHFKKEQKSDELFEYYICILRNSISHLKTLSLKDSAPNTNKTSPLRRKEMNCNVILISSLKDFTHLLSSSKFSNIGSECSNNNGLKCKKSTEVLTVETDLPSKGLTRNKTQDISTSILPTILQVLLELSNSNTYPNTFLKSEAIELSLSALLIISELYPKKFIAAVSDLSICPLISPHQNLTSFCSALKLLISLSPHKEFASHLIHKTGYCLLCSVATLCNIIFNSPKKYSFCMTLVEDFLSCTFTVHLLETEFQSSSCISEVIQNLITTLLKYLQIKEDINLSPVIMKKGFMLLHFISSCIPNFKEKRSSVEDEYISLIAGLLTLSKESFEFREFYDLLHNMWDFQTDVNEFDLDEPSEETQTSNSDTDVTD